MEEFFNNYADYMIFSLRDEDAHKYCDIVMRKEDPTIVFEMLATYHAERTAKHPLSVKEVVHFHLRSNAFNNDVRTQKSSLLLPNLQSFYPSLFLTN
jgi:hypothetical protein